MYTFLTLLRRQTSLMVLLALCAYYSIMTYQEQFPNDAAAGRRLANSIMTRFGDPCVALVAIRDTAQDREFGMAVVDELQRQGGVAVLRQVKGGAEARQALADAVQIHPRIQVIVANEDVARLGPFQPEKLTELSAQMPGLQETQVMLPESYYWPSFLMRQNLLNVVNQNADIAILAIGMTLVIIAAGIDLSVGSVLALCAVLAAILMETAPRSLTANPWLTAGCCLLIVIAGGVMGTLNGSMATLAGIPAFIVTLATMMIARGLALICAVNYQSYLQGGTTEGTPEAVRIQVPGFDWLGNDVTLGIPNPIWLMLMLYLCAHLLMTRTALGRYIYAVGGNAEAARLSGVPVKTVLIAVYALCGAMAALGGIVDSSRFLGGRPSAGEMYELRVIAAVVVGGTSLSGGSGTIVGTLIGTLIIAVIENGLNMSNVPSYERMVVFGALILVAALLDRFKK